MLTCDKEAKQTLPARNWTLVWSDEFDDTRVSKANASNWTYELGRGPNSDGWGNLELQTYTDKLSNVFIDGKGFLNIVATKTGSAFESGRIITKDKFSQKYGKFEARVKVPFGQGIWPAFWMMGQNFDTVGWPNCGEIDVLEIVGSQPNIAFSTIHGPGYSGEKGISKKYYKQDGRWDEDFHIYAVEWFEDRLDFFIDGYLYHRIAKSDVEAKGKWVFDQPFFLLLNVAVGGNLPGPPNASTIFPQTMQVDYVRVYELKK
jgi:beta-glucanase (GH16 family)